MKKTVFAFLTLGISLFSSCVSEVDGNGKGTEESVEISTKQLNVTILLDLSDRIIATDTPNHTERDLAIVSNVVKYFKEDMRAKGAYMAKGKIQVVFSPAPSNSTIASLAKTLVVDLGPMDNKTKKYYYDNMDSIFTSSLRKIYDMSIQSNSWVGCDIWRFFKDEIDLYKDDDYNNIFIVVTDGYIYHQSSVMQQGNRYSYLLPNLIRSKGLDNPTKCLDIIATQDLGFIATRKDLNDTKVLFLELNPNSSRPSDFDVMKEFLGKWCSEMGVQKYACYKTALPVQTEKAIKKFLD